MKVFVVQIQMYEGFTPDSFPYSCCDSISCFQAVRTVSYEKSCTRTIQEWFILPDLTTETTNSKL